MDILEGSLSVALCNFLNHAFYAYLLNVYRLTQKIDSIESDLMLKKLLARSAAK